MAIFMEGKKNGNDNSKGLTATSEDILQGKTAEVNGEIVTGNMADLTNTTNPMCGYETIGVIPHP